MHFSNSELRIWVGYFVGAAAGLSLLRRESGGEGE